MTNSAQKSATSSPYLNPDLKSPAAQEFEDKLMDLIVGQERAVRRIPALSQIFLASLSYPRPPVCTLPSLWPSRSRQTPAV